MRRFYPKQRPRCACGRAGEQINLHGEQPALGTRLGRAARQRGNTGRSLAQPMARDGGNQRLHGTARRGNGDGDA